MRLSPILLRLLALGVLLACTLPLSAAQTTPPSLAGAYRQDVNGWVYIHIAGDPRTLGYQNGYLVAPDFDDLNRTLQVYLLKTTGKSWSSSTRKPGKILRPAPMFENSPCARLRNGSISSRKRSFGSKPGLVRVR